MTGLGNPDFLKRRPSSSSSARAKIARDHSFETRLRPETVPVALRSCLRLSSDGSLEMKVRADHVCSHRYPQIMGLDVGWDRQDQWDEIATEGQGEIPPK